MSRINTLTQTQLNRIRSQMGLTEQFTILSIDKEVLSSFNQKRYQTRCKIPEDYYLVTVEDKKQGLKNGFIRLNNLSSE